MDKKLMNTDAGKSEPLAHWIVDGAEMNQEHVGRRLVDSLNDRRAADAVRGSNFNPADIDGMEFDDVKQWLDDHIVFNDKGSPIGVFDDGDWLWEADGADD